MSKEGMFHNEAQAKSTVTHTEEVGVATRSKIETESLSEKQLRIQKLHDEIEALQNKSEHVKVTHDAYGVPIEHFHSSKSYDKGNLDPATRAYFYPEEDDDELTLKKKQIELVELEEEIKQVTLESKPKKEEFLKLVKKNLYAFFQLPFLK